MKISNRWGPYPEYRPSGRDWMGDIPASWQILPLRRLLVSIEQGWSPVADDRPAEEGEWAVIRLSAVSKGAFRPSEHKALPEDVEPDARYEIREGDFLLTRANTPDLVGDVCVVGSTAPRLMLCDLVYRLTVAPGRIDPRFLCFWLLSTPGRRQIVADARGSSLSMVKVSQGHIRDWVAPVPPLNEQQAIVAYLSREAARIDVLLSDKERLLSLLQEERETQVCRCVTRGLDSSAPMKESDVDWFPEMPEHWACAPLSSHYHVQLGKMLDEKRITGEHLAPYLRNVDVQWDSINVEDLPMMDFPPGDRERFHLRKGDLLVCEGGEVGRTAMWTAEVEECYYQKALHRVRPLTRQHVPRFLFYVLKAAAHSGAFVAGGNSNTIDHLPAEKLRKHRFPFPPKEEQLAIADFLDRETASIDGLAADVRQGIAKLKEYRTALISSAVTGKIDVRHAREV